MLRYNGVLGITLITKLQLVALPQASVAVQVTRFVPTGKRLPDGGAQVTIGLGSHESVVLTLKAAGAPLLDVATVLFGGQRRIGAWCPRR